MIFIDETKYHWEICKICSTTYSEDNSKGHSERCLRC